MKKVLLTGASGFIGRHTIPFLINSGYEVFAIYHNIRPSLREDSHFTLYQCNLLNPEEQKHLLEKVKPTHLLHFAWYTTPGKYWSSVENLRWMQSSLDLLIYFLDEGGKRAVLAGTCAEYDWSYGYCSERVTPAQPSSLYGICKHSLQEILKEFSRNKGLSSAWGRIFFLYGPHEHPHRLISSVINSILRGEPAHCSHGNQIRDFLFVEDVASAFVALLESDFCGPVNVASGYPVVLKDLINKIGEKLNRSDLIQFASGETSLENPNLLIADVSRLNNEVGWLPKYTLDQGLDETINWWGNHLLKETNEI